MNYIYRIQNLIRIYEHYVELAGKKPESAYQNQFNMRRIMNVR